MQGGEKCNSHVARVIMSQIFEPIQGHSLQHSEGDTMKKLNRKEQ